jgi:hypothetical protein
MARSAGLKRSRSWRHLLLRTPADWRQVLPVASSVTLRIVSRGCDLSVRDGKRLIIAKNAQALFTELAHQIRASTGYSFNLPHSRAKRRAEFDP